MITRYLIFIFFFLYHIILCDDDDQSNEYNMRFKRLRNMHGKNNAIKMMMHKKHLNYDTKISSFYLFYLFIEYLPSYHLDI